MPIHDAAPPTEPGAAPAAETGPAAGTGVAKPGRTAEIARTGSQIGQLLSRVPPRWRMPLATYVSCQLIYLLWWAAYYPGLASYDSIIYVVHVTTGPWVANHSVLYDSMVWLSLHVTGSYAGLTLAQTVAASATFGYAVAAFRRLGVPGRWTAIAAVVLAVLPPTGTLIVFVWKDTAFTLCAVLIVCTLAHLVSLRGAPGWQRDRRVAWLVAVLGLEMLGLTLFRPNGFLIVAISAIFMVALLPGVRARVATVAVAAICMFFVLNFAVYPAVGIQQAPTSLTYGPVYADIAVAYAASPSSFTQADTRLMTKVAPLAAWKNTADCYTSDTTTSAVPGFTTRATKLNSQLFALWARILKRTPSLIAGARICRASIAWNVFSGPAKLRGGVQIPADTPPADLFGLGSRPDVRHNPYHSTFYPHPLSQSLHKIAMFLYSLSQTSQLQWLLWRGAFWCYLSYLVLFAYGRARRNWAVLSLGAILIGQQIGILLDNPAQLYRYMISPIFTGILLVPLFFARNRPSRRITR
jgi:hypothetical protein